MAIDNFIAEIQKGVLELTVRLMRKHAPFFRSVDGEQAILQYAQIVEDGVRKGLGPK